MLTVPAHGVFFKTWAQDIVSEGWCVHVHTGLSSFASHLAFDNFLASWHIFCSILRHLETSFPDPLRKRQRFYSLSDLLSTKSTRRQASLPLLLEGLGQSLLRDRTPSVQAGNLSDENSRGDVMGTLCQDGSGAAVQW